MKKVVLIGDFGGTNLNFALLEIIGGDFKIISKKNIILKENFNIYNLINNIIEDFKIDFKLLKLEIGCFGVAGMVRNGNVSMTNRNIYLSEKELVKKTYLKKVKILNDFEAISYGIDILNSKQVKILNKGKKDKNGNKLIVGAGTDFGISILPYSNKFTPILSEGAHCQIGAENKFELKLFEFLKKKYNIDYVRIGNLLSGKGIEDIYEFLTKKISSANQLSKIKNKNKYAKETFEIFFNFYSRICINLSITTLYSGGIYLAGGIIGKNLDFDFEIFLKEFTNSQKFNSYLKDIPIKIILDYDISLFGLGNYIIKNKIFLSKI